MTDWFDRVPMEYRPVIEAAHHALPPPVAALCRPRFLCGISPRFVGLHYYDASYDRDFHACFEYHTPDKRSTIVLPSLPTVRTVIHEFGHIFDEATHFELLPPRTTQYSTKNRMECVAEAFMLMFTPPDSPGGDWCETWTDYLSAESFRPFRKLVSA